MIMKQTGVPLFPKCSPTVPRETGVTTVPLFPTPYMGERGTPKGTARCSPAKVEASAGSPSQSLDTLRLFQVEVTNLGQLSADIPFLTHRADQREHPCSRIDVVNNASDVVRRCRTGGNIARE
jgi:hypothetical protein